MKKVILGIGVFVMFILILGVTYFFHNRDETRYMAEKEIVTGSTGAIRSAIGESLQAMVNESMNENSELDSLMSTIFEEFEVEDNQPMELERDQLPDHSETKDELSDSLATESVERSTTASTRDTIDVLLEKLVKLEALLGVKDDSLRMFQTMVVQSGENTAKKDNLPKLVKMMEEMKPNEMKGIANGLDDEFLIDILLKMKARNAAKVLAVLEPQRASRVSMLMAKE
jgi:flagellar motility protein MotE (MotC chaperone)